MRKLFFYVFFIISASSCINNNEGESGVVNDGIEPIDPNGALIDSTPLKSWDPSIDTAKGEHRVDTWQRDSPEVRR